MMHTVFLSDKNSPSYDDNKEYFETFHKWALDNCPSYMGYKTHDVSDATIYYDEITEYNFSSSHDYELFKEKINEDL